MYEEDDDCIELGIGSAIIIAIILAIDCYYGSL